VIKRYQKQLASLHGLQQSPARFDPGDRLAQRGGKAVKDGGAQHELNSVAPKTTEQFGKYAPIGRIAPDSRCTYTVKSCSNWDEVTAMTRRTAGQPSVLL
jgi:hypothetical protein